MKTPTFWKTKNLLSTLLYPLGILYGFATYLRMAFNKPKKINRPVICIGNLTAGGTGKTPVAIAIAKMLQSQNKHPYFISRGYGGKLSDIIVNKEKHTPQEVGDEPLLLANQAPVVVNHNRYQAAFKAVKSGAEIIIMDDGFQNPQLHKDLSFIVVDGGFGFGNERCIPSGPLRENIKNGLKRAQAIIIINPTPLIPSPPYRDVAKRRRMRERDGVRGLKTFNASISPIKPKSSHKEIIAFAGIGRPEKFYNSLVECGFVLKQTFDFPDHHYYCEKELKDIIKKANGLDIYTTTKDMVKIPHNLQNKFKVLEIEIKWENEEALRSFINERI